jgi:hypothetical protein
MELTRYANRIKKRRPSNVNTEAFDEFHDERLSLISSRLSQYDQWSGFMTPEEYWGSFITFSKKRNFLNRSKRFCQDKKDARRLADCLNRCDNRIIFDGLPVCADTFRIELSPYLSPFIINALVYFFFRNYSAFINSTNLSEIWRGLIKSNTEVLHSLKLKKLFLNNIDDFIANTGHMFLYNLFEKDRSSDFRDFVKTSLFASNQFMESQFFQASIRFQANIILENPRVTVDNIIHFANTVLSLKKTNLIIIGLSSCIVKIRNSFLENEVLKTQIRDLAIIHIGDPRNKQKWHSDESYYSRRIEAARKELMKWQNEKIAIQYFEAMQFDPDRKNFWMRHIRDMDEVKITIYQPHIRDNYKLVQLFDENPESFVISEKSSISCLLMKHKDYLFIEYSKHGNALYVYEYASSIYQSFSKDRIVKSSEFKDGYAYMKLIHRQGWQSEVNKLLRKL